MARHPHAWIRPLAAVILLVVAVGCGSSSGAEEAQQRERAEDLVTATQAAGVAPRLTVDTAEALYGTEAPAVCEAFRGGSTTSAELILRGNAFRGRRKAITPEAVTYARLVVETYCPDVLQDFRRGVRDIQPLDTGS